MRGIDRRELLTGAAALAAYGRLSEAGARSRVPVPLGSAGIPSWVKPGAVIDEIFTTGQYWPRPITSELVDTRTSSKFLTPATGNLFQVANNVLPISSGGMLVEASAVNPVLQSQTFTTSPWQSGSGTRTGGATAPDGTSTAFTFAGSSVGSGVYQLGVAVVSAAAYVDTLYLQNSSGAPVVRVGNDVGGNRYSQFNLSTLAIANTNAVGSLVALPNGWYRAQIAWSNLGQTSADALVQEESGTSCSFLAWGYNRTLASAGSYIPATTTAVTRNADSIVLQRTGIGRIVFTFDDSSTQTISGISTGSQYTIPTNLNRPLITRMTGYAS